MGVCLMAHDVSYGVVSDGGVSEGSFSEQSAKMTTATVNS